VIAPLAVFVLYRLLRPILRRLPPTSLQVTR
jgi:hypothetical protein